MFVTGPQTADVGKKRTSVLFILTSQGQIDQFTVRLGSQYGIVSASWCFCFRVSVQVYLCTAFHTIREDAKDKVL